MNDIDIKKLFDDAFEACKTHSEDDVMDNSITRVRYARLIGAYEHLVKTLARTESDRRIVRDVLEGLAYDALNDGE